MMRSSSLFVLAAFASCLLASGALYAQSDVVVAPSVPVDASASGNSADATPATAPGASGGATAGTVSVVPYDDMLPQMDERTPMEKEIADRLSYLKPTINPSRMPSLLFSKWEYDVIADARLGKTTSTAANASAADGELKEPGPRELSLSGIVYVSSHDWTVWLNGMRVMPKALPPQIMDIKVHKDFIELEWFDETTNQIYPVRLRTHQRFNLDTRLFLPG